MSVRGVHERVPSKEADLGALLGYDGFRRACLLDGLLPEAGEPDALHPWDEAHLAFGGSPMEHLVQASSDRITVVFSVDDPEGWLLGVRKTLAVPAHGGEVSVAYRIDWRGGMRLRGRWAVQWNLALTGGAGPLRYYRLAGRPPLRSRGVVADRRRVELVDAWAAIAVSLAWERPATLAWAPVETVSLSEAGFERIFQGTALLLSWPLDLAPGQEWREQMRLSIQELPRDTG